MRDLIIRGGTVVDGTDAAEHTADVAIVGDRITAVGQGLGPAKREIDADGLLVTPGFVYIHTHHDGQATWDPYLTPSSWRGVTHRGDHRDPARHAGCGNFAARDDNRTPRS